MALQFSITEYQTGNRFNADEKRQWNTTLSFASYLLTQRNAAVDFRVMLRMLVNRRCIRSSTLNMFDLLPNDQFPEHIAFTLEYQDMLAEDFSAMLFGEIQAQGASKALFESLFRDIICAAKALDKDFTAVDAAYVFLRFAVIFEYMVPPLFPADESAPRPEVFDGYMKPFIVMMKKTNFFGLDENTRNQLAFLAQCITAFRLAPGFPCVCKDAEKNDGTLTILSCNYDRMNGWLDIRKVIEGSNPKVAEQSNSGVVKHPELAHIGPVLVAWLMFSPRKREDFVKLMLSKGSFTWSFIPLLFSKSESPEDAGRLSVFLYANKEHMEAREQKANFEGL